MKRKRERIVQQVLEYFSQPENFTKSLADCARELGYSYDALRQAIRRYGSQEFYGELLTIKTNLLREATGIAIAKLYERLTNPKSDADFYKAQMHIREWHRVLLGTLERIEARIVGQIEHKHLVEFLREAREKIERARESQGKSGVATES